VFADRSECASTGVRSWPRDRTPGRSQWANRLWRVGRALRLAPGRWYGSGRAKGSTAPAERCDVPHGRSRRSRRRLKPQPPRALALRARTHLEGGSRRRGCGLVNRSSLTLRFAGYSHTRLDRSSVSRVSWPCGQHPQLQPESHRQRESAARREVEATGCDCGAGARLHGVVHRLGNFALRV